MALSRAAARQASVLFSRVLLSSFEGVARGSYESGRHSVMELTLALPHNVVQWRGWPHQEGWRNSAGTGFQGGVSGLAWQGFTFDLGARVVSEQLMLWSGEWVRERRTRESLERGGDPPEGAHSPRARRNLARRGVQPSSEAEFRQYGAVPLERSRASLDGCWGRPFDGLLRLPGPWAPVTGP
jgi:hypothetical protein